MSGLLRAAYDVLLVGGVLALVYCGYVVFAAHSYQAIQRSQFESTGKIAEHLPAIEGNAIGEMEVPRVGLNAVFVQGDSPKILRRAVGHISETALPGEPGNVVLTAHRDTFFRPLRNIRSGDTIELETLDGEFAYQVDWTQVVSPSDVEVLQASGENTLTLVTCFPFYFVGPAPKRFIVRAHQIGPLPASSGLPESQIHR
ncbi:MAG TPA: class D sortase [Candidatus Acidoferrales bacterium]|nr:class D sortase [Candidatus Acidoferrales bacterium]